MEKRIVMTDGNDLIMVYREPSLKHLYHTSIGAMRFDNKTCNFRKIYECLMPTADDVGCDHEFERLLDKAETSGYYYPNCN